MQNLLALIVEGQETTLIAKRGWHGSQTQGSWNMAFQWKYKVQMEAWNSIKGGETFP